MKKINYIIVVLFSSLAVAHADTTSSPAGAVVVSTPPVTADISTTTLAAHVLPVRPSSGPASVAFTGETKTEAMPDAMTTPVNGVFVTLTRTAYQSDALPTNAEIVKPDTFKIFDSQNAGDAVARQTSIQQLPTGAVGGLSSTSLISIRGAKSAQTLILIDGRPMEGFALGTPDLSEIPTEQIDHIEIVRGGASALYGPNAIGGVINVITKRAQYHGLPVSHLGYESGSYGRQGYTLDFGSRAGPVDYYFYGDNKWISGFRDNSDDRQYNVGGNLGVSMGQAGKFLFDLSSYHNRAGVPGLNCGPNDPNCFVGTPLQPNQFNNRDEKISSAPNARQVTDTNYIRTSYLLPLPSDSLLTVRAFGMQREVQSNDSADPNPFTANESDRHEQSKGTEAQIALPYGFLLGGNFLHDREDNTDILSPANTFIRSLDNWGIFGQENFKYDFLTIIPSGRFDHNSQAGDTKNPRVQTIAEATDWLRFSGSAGRSFRAPTMDELFFVSPYFIGNPNLKPETAWTYDAGFELHKDSFSFQATYYRADVSNLIQGVQSDPANLASPFSSTNIGTARRQGAEIKIDHVVNEYFRDSWNYTFLRNVGILPGGNVFVPLQFSPKHTVNYIGTFSPTAKWSIDAIARYEDSRYSGNNQGGYKLGSELIFGMRVAYQWRQLEVYLGGNDLNNKRYVEQPGYPLPGINFYGGMTLHLWG
jgi:outer membrane receptor protein involved in Fe transport